MRKYGHLTDIERNSIAHYLKYGLSYSEIGRLLDRSNSTICREVNRNSKENGQYEPAYAHTAYKERLISRKTCEKLTPEIKEQIKRALSLNYAPMSISGVYRKKRRTFRVFVRFIGILIKGWSAQKNTYEEKESHLNGRQKLIT